jgi:hypothetical protein
VLAHGKGLKDRSTPLNQATLGRQQVASPPQIPDDAQRILDGLAKGAHKCDATQA